MRSPQGAGLSARPGATVSALSVTLGLQDQDSYGLTHSLRFSKSEISKDGYVIY